MIHLGWGGNTSMPTATAQHVGIGGRHECAQHTHTGVIGKSDHAPSTPASESVGGQYARRHTLRSNYRLQAIWELPKNYIRLLSLLLHYLDWATWDIIYGIVVVGIYNVRLSTQMFKGHQMPSNTMEGALYTLINGVLKMFYFITVFFFVKCSFSSGCIELDRILVISFGVESASAGLTCQSNKSLSRRIEQEQHRIQSAGLIKCCCLYRRFCRSYCIHMKLGNLKIGCSIFRSITHGPFQFHSKGWSCWISTDIYRPCRLGGAITKWRQLSKPKTRWKIVDNIGCSSCKFSTKCIIVV